MMKKISPKNFVFFLFSFEGPDPYSQAGGLGVRISGLAKAIAKNGFDTHLFFIGDPYKNGEEKEGNLTLHRWCQWISHYHPFGVYDGEERKKWDFERSVPNYLLENFLKNKKFKEKFFVFMGEEWQTSQTILNITSYLPTEIEKNCLFLWNANNIFSFDRIDWENLKKVATITTISKYMKNLLSNLGISSLVIPNGIPNEWLGDLEDEICDILASNFKKRMLLVKVARFDPNKGWIQAIESLALLKKMGILATMAVRGGIEPYGKEVFERAWKLGLDITDIELEKPSLKECLAAIVANKETDIINLRFFLPEKFLKILFSKADAVLANSSFEPFGLVGLEVMAVGGIAFTGSTGEDYARSFENAIMIETEKPQEIVVKLNYLKTHPKEAEKIRREAKKTAKSYLWEKIVQELLIKMEFLLGI